MKDSSGKRKLIAFTEEEKTYLLDLVQKYREIVDCKKTNSAANLAKKRVWVQIAEEFNGQPLHFSRSPVHLKKCYENLQSRKRAAENKKKLHDDLASPIDVHAVGTVVPVATESLLDGSINFKIINADEDPFWLLNNKGEGGENSTEVVSEEVIVGSHSPLKTPLSQEPEHPHKRRKGNYFQPSSDIERELRKVQLQEAKVKLQIQEEFLRKAEVELEMAMMKKTYEEEILKVRLSGEKRKYNL